MPPTTAPMSARIRNRVRFLMRLQGRTQQQLANAFGRSRPWASYLLGRGARNRVDIDDLEPMARFLDVPVTDLMRSDEDLTIEVTPKERECLQLFRSAPKAAQESVTGLLRELVAQQQSRRATRPRG